MRLDPRGIYLESGFRLDFTSAIGSIIHDKPYPEDGNNVWDGVDFRIFENDFEVWVEIKSWSFKTIRDSVERRSAKRDYRAKLYAKRAEEFRDEIFYKFLGTTAYLGWSGISLPQKVRYVVFLEPPDRGNGPLLRPFQDLLRERFKNMPDSLRSRISFGVVTVEQFNEQFPQYPVTHP